MNIKDLTIEEINVILVALGKLPLETTIALFTKIKTQAESQLAELKEKQERTTDTVEVKN